MKKWIVLAVAAVLVFWLLAGCTVQKAEIAMVTDGHSTQEMTLNREIWGGIVKYGEEQGISHRAFQPKAETQQAVQETIDQAVQGGAMVVVCVGQMCDEPVLSSAAQYPQVRFLAVDCVLPAELPQNVTSISYTAVQGGFLAGYAAVKEGMTSLGFLGEAPEGQSVEYGYGFVQGAEYAAQSMGLAPGSVQMRYAYLPDRSMNEVQGQSQQWYESGVQAIFSYGEQMNRAVMRAAEEMGGSAIGADIDRSAQSPSVAISAIKNYSTTVYDALDLFYQEQLPAGQLVLDASGKGVALALENARLTRFARKDYDSLLARMENQTDAVVQGIVTQPAADGSIAAAQLALSCVAVDETGAPPQE